ncbi:hypothetical protein RN001_004412 [Aquatica leii]|uniref:Endonuclease/exonuclease/phosphatase domain-containing protein n=1 Tax=Aquatica leii TaxID=1421715 RepID=A0AAN7PBL0_9COLE|nr:hypothetical protein RN001_004412 [Aquatica leii]
MKEIGRQIERYKISILALHEIRWVGEGRVDKAKYSIFYGGNEKQGQHGTAFMIDKKIKNKLIQFKKIDGRISYLRIKKSCEKIPKHDTLIVLGDYNAKIGREDFIKDVAGKETIHEITTDNGMRLCHLATEMDMYIISTKFKHKKEHKITWNIPGKNKGNQIDHILIKKNRERMIDDNYKRIRKEGAKLMTEKKREYVNKIMDEIKNDNKSNTKLYQQLRTHKKKKNLTANIARNTWENYLLEKTKEEEESQDERRDLGTLLEGVSAGQSQTLRRRRVDGVFAGQCQTVEIQRSV